MHFNRFIDPHGHGIGSHAAHGPEGADLDDKLTSSDVEGAQSGHFDDSAMAQIIGVFILEFGVLLHRYVHFSPWVNRC